MASAGLRAELECSVCLNIYTDPVMLICGHNFCRVCINRVLDTQEESGDYACPVCRNKFRRRPALHRNISLNNIVVHFLSAQPKQESGVFCTRCVNSPVPAVRSCLHCEVSLCNEHLRVHNKSPEHILTEPTLSMERRKCPVHKKILEYYCTEDETGVCVSCMIGGHTGHKVVSLNEAPLTVLQESDTGDLCDTEHGDNEDRERHEELLHDRGGLGVAGVLHTGLSDITTDVFSPIQEAADLLLDVNTVFKYLYISDDRKTVSGSDLYQNYPENPERFQYCPQVMSIQSFSSGRHYWEVKVGGSQNWIVGMCYPSIDRGALLLSEIGEDNKSWGLYRGNDHYWVAHNSNEIPLSANLSSNRVGIYLDYEAGRISFYDMCDPIRHIHTYTTTTFAEPLHAVLGVWFGSLKICGGNNEV